jgi:hypothetical protein
VVLIWQLDPDAIHKLEHRYDGGRIAMELINVVHFAFLEELALFMCFSI